MEKTAVVTGGNRGIGLEVVRQLARRGFRVFLGARRKADADKALRQLAAERASVQPLILDVTDRKTLMAAVKQVDASAGRLDALVNNAGILLDESTPVTEVSEETFLKTIRTNAWGALQVTQAFLPLLRKSKEARVVNVSSGAGSLNDMSTYAPAYSISKAALNAVTRQLSSALSGIPVNSVCPGWVRTDMGGKEAPRSVEQGADTIVWLAAEAPRSITGQFLRDRKAIAW
jgi:NAD(P)-dependent dehydrogenase (short-subunit alcohol dehydrogenase family)